MTAERQIFNALVWKYNWRRIQISWDLSEVMRYCRQDTADECQAFELSRPVAALTNTSKSANT
jgi:hypothetical protein